jgi:hypothetical protein
VTWSLIDSPSGCLVWRPVTRLCLLSIRSLAFGESICLLSIRSLAFGESICLLSVFGMERG